MDKYPERILEQLFGDFPKFRKSIDGLKSTPQTPVCKIHYQFSWVFSDSDPVPSSNVAPNAAIGLDLGVTFVGWEGGKFHGFSGFANGLSFRCRRFEFFV